MLSPRHIEQYQAIYLKLYGKEITPEEAERQGERLVALMKLLFYKTPTHSSQK